MVCPRHHLAGCARCEPACAVCGAERPPPPPGAARGFGFAFVCSLACDAVRARAAWQAQGIRLRTEPGGEFA